MSHNHGTRRARLVFGLMLLAITVAVAGLRRPVEAEEAPAARTNWPDFEIEGKLRMATSVDFGEGTLRQALARLREMTGVPMTIDSVALRNDGASADEIIVVEPLEDIALKSVLNIVLSKGKVGLAFVIQDGAVLVTTERVARRIPTIESYDVADLIGPPVSKYKPLGPKFPNPEMERILDVLHPKENRTTLKERLMSLIQETIAPASWSDYGGIGTIKYIPLCCAFFVYQTPDVQEQIADLLNTLRRLQDTQVSIEFRYIAVSAAMAKRLEKFGIAIATVPASIQVVPLDDMQLFQIQDIALNIKRAAKFAMQNSQMMTIEVPSINGEQLSIAVQATVTDYKSVQLALEMPRPASTQSPTPVRHTFSVKDGQTAVLTGWQARPAGEMAEDAYLLLAVTPRIIIREEDEMLSTGVSSDVR